MMTYLSMGFCSQTNFIVNIIVHSIQSTFLFICKTVFGSSIIFSCRILLNLSYWKNSFRKLINYWYLWGYKFLSFCSAFFSITFFLFFVTFTFLILRIIFYYIFIILLTTVCYVIFFYKKTMAYRR